MSTKAPKPKSAPKTAAKPAKPKRQPAKTSKTSKSKQKNQPKLAHQGLGPRGFPSGYDAQFHPDKAYKLALGGFTVTQIADIFGIHEATLMTWQDKHPELYQALRNGREMADAEIAHAMYQRAKGYSHPEEKIFCQNGEIVRAETIKHYPPDTGAASNWLANRRPDKWGKQTQDDATPKKVRHIHEIDTQTLLKIALKDNPELLREVEAIEAETIEATPVDEDVQK